MYKRIYVNERLHHNVLKKKSLSPLKVSLRQSSDWAARCDVGEWAGRSGLIGTVFCGSLLRDQDRQLRRGFLEDQPGRSGDSRQLPRVIHR